MNATSTVESAFRVARFAPTVDTLTTVAGRSSIVLRCDDCLHLIDESRIDAVAREHGSFELDRSPDAPLVVAGLEPDASLSVAGARVMLVRRGGVEFLSLEQNVANVRVPLPQFNGPVVAAVAPAHGTRMLCVVRDESDPDLNNFQLHFAGDGLRDASSPPILESSLPPHIAWCERIGAYLVFSPADERLWRIAHGQHQPVEIELPKSPGRSVRAVFLHPSEAWLAAELFDPNDAGSYIAHAILTSDGLRWDTVTRLADGLHRHFRWRPAARELLAVRSLRRSNALVVLNALGGLIAEFPLPKGWFVRDLCWSGDGRRALAAGSVGVGVWFVS